MRLFQAAGLIGLVLLLSGADAQTLPPGFSQSTVASNLSWPTRMAFAPDGRLFVLEQAGRIRLVKNGQLLASPFAAVTTQASIISNEEQGLLGVAVDPNFAVNGYVYVYYTALNPNRQRISRFRANPPSADIADGVEGEVPLIDFERGGCHCGGALDFGPDGKLYAGTGDGYTDPNPQSLSSHKGKILRMNPVPDSIAQVPSDNPFYATATGRYRLIWALGLRNPYSMAFQPGTGKLFVNDVGSSLFEEINEVLAGRNFGWPATEGPFSTSQFPQYTNPLLAYQRSGGSFTGSLIVGGTFYNPPVPQFPQEYVGKYFFSDYAYNGWIRYLDPANPATTTVFVPSITAGNYLDLKVSPDGALYYLRRSATGSVVRVGYGASPVSPSRNNANGSSLQISRLGEKFRLTFAIPQVGAGESWQLLLQTISARTVAVLAGGSAKPGIQSVTWSATEARHGVYQAVLRIGDVVWAKRLIWVD